MSSPTSSKSQMRVIKVYYDNGDVIRTNINGTDQEILDYFLGREVNIGSGANDLIATAIRVEFL